MIFQNSVPGNPRMHVLLLGSLQNKPKSWLLYQVFELFPSGVDELPFWEGTGFPSWACEIQCVPGGAYSMLLSSLFFTFHGPGFISLILLLARSIIGLDTRKICLEPGRSSWWPNLGLPLSKMEWTPEGRPCLTLPPLREKAAKSSGHGSILQCLNVGLFGTWEN